MSEPLSSANLRDLLEQVSARYGSIDAFCAQLYLSLDYATTELPAPTALSEADGGRHRPREAC